MKAPKDGWDADEHRTLSELQTEIEELRKRHANDPPLELLRAARHDALPPDLQEEVGRFVSTDAWSGALIEGVDGAAPSLDSRDEDRLLARIRKEAAQDEQARRPRWRWLQPALAAAALATVFLAVWIVRQPAVPAVPAVSSGPGTIAAPAATPPVDLPLAAPEMMLSTAALTWRGAGTGNQYLADLKPAVDAFRAADYGRADREFAALESRYPGGVEVFYYGGVARLLMNDSAKAIASLRKARELADATFAPHVDWYFAVAEHRAGDIPEARARLDRLCGSASSRQGQACAALTQLGPR